MNIAVLVKWVPEPQGTPTLGPDHLLVREGADGALDPGDEYGLERALQLVERDGGEVTLVSMGPEVAVAAVQRGLAMGAHRAVLVTDDAVRGADTLVTARVLSAALRSIDADLVVAAVESTDGYTGTLPITVAELLGLPSVTFATSIDVVDGSRLRAERQTGQHLERHFRNLDRLAGLEPLVLADDRRQRRGVEFTTDEVAVESGAARSGRLRVDHLDDVGQRRRRLGGHHGRRPQPRRSGDAEIRSLHA